MVAAGMPESSSVSSVPLVVFTCPRAISPRRCSRSRSLFATSSDRLCRLSMLEKALAVSSASSI
jgi:hypothetical protein